MLREKGKLTSWKDDKGYGFVTADDGKQYFVHISAFGPLPRRPQVEDSVEFQIADARDGKQKAVNAVILGLGAYSPEKPRAAPATRPRPAPPAAVRAPRPHRRPKRSFGLAYLALPVAIVSGVYAFDRLRPYWFAQESAETPTAALPYTVTTRAEPIYLCSGKVYCSEMSSCEEARFYLRNCPGTKMDGDLDGIPCESQWCQ